MDAGADEAWPGGRAGPAADGGDPRGGSGLPSFPGPWDEQQLFLVLRRTISQYNSNELYCALVRRKTKKLYVAAENPPKV